MKKLAAVPAPHWSGTPYGEHWPSGAGIYAEFARAFNEANPGLSWGIEFDVAATPWRTTMHRLSVEGLGEFEFTGIGPHVSPYDLARIWPMLAWTLVEVSVALAFLTLAKGAPQIAAAPPAKATRLKGRWSYSSYQYRDFGVAGLTGVVYSTGHSPTVWSWGLFREHEATGACGRVELPDPKAGHRLACERIDEAAMDAARVAA